MILVTGGAGFIGSVLVQELNKLNEKNIVIVDRLGKENKWKNLRNVVFQDFIHADDFFQDNRDDLFSGLKGIYHLGACSSTTQTDVDFLMSNNYSFSKNIFQIATHFQIPLVYASSAATYGAGEKGYSDQAANKKGDDFFSLRPLNPYGLSKKVFDDWALQQKSTPEKWFGVKFFNVYGPNEYHKADMRSLVEKAFGQIKQSGQVKLFKSHRPDFKDGEQKRDFIYVVDAARALVQLMNKAKNEDSGLINLGTGQCRTFLDLVNATFKAVGKDPQIQFIDMPNEIRHQYQYFTEADMKRFKKVLPQFKFHSLEEGVTDYVKNFLMQDEEVNRYYH